VDFQLSEEQTLLKQSVERFLRDAYDFDTRQKLVASGEGFSRDNWRTFAELGWLGVGLPEANGGFGGAAETMIVMEGFGAALVVEPYLSTVVLGAGLIAAAGSAAQRRDLLPRVAAGDLMLAVAFAEPQARFNLADTRTAASRHGGGWHLTGTKIAVLGGPSADAFIVSARTAGAERDRDGISLFLVEAGAVERRDYRTVDGLRASELTFDQISLSEDSLVGAVGEGLGALEAVVDRAIAAIAAEAVGCMQVLHDDTKEYLKTRKQFGAPLARFQVLQHRMVDMFMELEQARSVTLMATLQLDAEPATRSRAAAKAKAYIGKAGPFVGAQAVQLHGGMGMTNELRIGHYYKRLMQIDTLFGNRDWHLKRLTETV